MTALDYCGKYGLLSLIKSMYLGVFGQGNSMSVLSDWLSGNNGVLKNYDTIINSARSLINVCIGISILFALIYFMWDISYEKLGPGRDITIEMLIMAFAKIIFAIFFIANVTTFTSAIFHISEAIYVNANSIISETPGGGNDIETLIDDYIIEIGQKCDEVEETPIVGGMLAQMQPFIEIICSITMLLAWLVSLVCEALVMFAIFGRQADLIIRTILAPLALSDLYIGGVRSRGFDYLKSFAGVCFQNIIILMIFWITNQITLVLLGSDTYMAGVTKLSDITNAQILLAVVAKLVQASMIMKSGQLAKEAFGTH